MAGDIINPDVVAAPPELPAVMVATVLEVVDGQALVTVQSYDGGLRAHRAFGAVDAGLVGRRVRVMFDELGGLVVVAVPPVA